MTKLTASLVRDLREKTGGGMMDCKRALSECDGDFEAAIDWLRKNGLVRAQKKAGRVASEGLIGACVTKGRGDLVEINAETDFVARNIEFIEFVGNVAQMAHHADGDLDQLNRLAMENGDSIEANLTELTARIGERIAARRIAGLAVEAGIVASYLHDRRSDLTGRIGVLVALESTGDEASLMKLGREIAMHCAAARPRYLHVGEVEAEVLEREREVLAAQARASGKPESVIEKMVEGRLRKFYEEIVLEAQIFVVDGKRTIAQLLADEQARLGVPIKLAGFVRFELGEGIEKRQDDFAAEVRATAQGN
ncbi:MAG: translation elongation factor Ts [Pseudomonadota bacterium]